MRLSTTATQYWQSTGPERTSANEFPALAKHRTGAGGRLDAKATQYRQTMYWESAGPEPARNSANELHRGRAPCNCKAQDQSSPEQAGGLVQKRLSRDLEALCHDY
ncbi:hypothetical protein T484DRAFT_1930859 [Baffinella frigidus]|nr:hypothetical protein T484DRAFT_1930859 [Cryptophyta sp. CCMP2293]